MRRAKKVFPVYSFQFSQLPVVKKDTKKCAPGKNFGPSYFVTTLVQNLSGICKKTGNCTESIFRRDCNAMLGAFIFFFF